MQYRYLLLSLGLMPLLFLLLFSTFNEADSQEEPNNKTNLEEIQITKPVIKDTAISIII